MLNNPRAVQYLKVTASFTLVLSHWDLCKLYESQDIFATEKSINDGSFSLFSQNSAFQLAKVPVK